MPRNSFMAPAVLPPTAPSAVATTGPVPGLSGLTVVAPAPAAVAVATRAPMAITPAPRRAWACQVSLIRNIRVSVSCGQSFLGSDVSCGQTFPAVRRFLRSDESADAGDGAADDQG